VDASDDDATSVVAAVVGGDATVGFSLPALLSSEQPVLAAATRAAASTAMVDLTA
jgi:hypothetical protein